MSTCPVCKLPIRGGDKRKVKGVWVHKHSTRKTKQEVERAKKK